MNHHPSRSRRRHSWSLRAGVLLVLAGLVAGGLLLTGVIGGPDERRDRTRLQVGLIMPQPPGPAADPAVDPAAGPAADGDVLAVRSWGREAGQLAVLVGNESTEPIASARVRVIARDAAGAVVLSTSGTDADVCCSVVGLPAGAEFGLFVPLAADVPEIATVAVETLSAETGSPADATVRVGAADLRRYDDDTVVAVRLKARGRLSGFVAVQALLVDGEGEVAQVISGRFYCFRPGAARTVRLHLFHAVPPGLRLDRVLAYPIPDGVRPHVPGRCR
ncbi:hypothetical protein KVF89_05595 [Nocardioides carbamazepini]|uniref:hypothetical protein n=1 Tax=Nocardioides carbamazepini TaxID=2854259 RepID=UPI00214A4E30|nr:hypothetical protein [Nocardioides carbamazepini]MCR1782000.1 hypothetical protein [Nocardioides carbamazepini]